MKLRADSLLVSLGLAADQKAAQALILAGRVFIPGDTAAIKPGTPLDAGTRLQIRGETPGEAYASFGGVKLSAAMAGFRIDAAGKVALDVGSSNGGFTDCLLRAGALRVYAVDVGYGLADWRLRQDRRVILLERENIRYLAAEKVPEPVDLATIDVSFISIRKVIPAVKKFMAPRSTLVVLIKPEFELPAREVPPGGVLRDRSKQAQILLGLGEFLEKQQLTVLGFLKSLKKRTSKNDEFFCHLRSDRIERGGTLEDLIHEVI
jgi:23S rRNA (cytidine1920-2'-O)/16S rRNA (cytidine1409-2'-O)-methyltransferase